MLEMEKTFKWSAYVWKCVCLSGFNWWRWSAVFFSAHTFSLLWRDIFGCLNNFSHLPPPHRVEDMPRWLWTFNAPIAIMSRWCCSNDLQTRLRFFSDYIIGLVVHHHQSSLQFYRCCENTEHEREQHKNVSKNFIESAPPEGKVVMFLL